MKKLILLTVVFFFAAFLFAQQNLNLQNCEIQIAGTSTLHDWTADVETITGTGTYVMTDGQLTDITSINLTMEAESIKSVKGSMMDKNMYKALKTSDFPNLKFELTDLVSFKKNGTEYNLIATGNLTVAGTTNAINLSAIGNMDANGTLTFIGSKDLKMTAYNVEPPELFFGSLVTGDDITIIFEATFKTTDSGPN